MCCGGHGAQLAQGARWGACEHRPPLRCASTALDTGLECDCFNCCVVTIIAHSPRWRAMHVRRAHAPDVAQRQWESDRTLSACASLWHARRNRCRTLWLFASVHEVECGDVQSKSQSKVACPPLRTPALHPTAARLGFRLGRKARARHKVLGHVARCRSRSLQNRPGLLRASSAPLGCRWGLLGNLDGTTIG